MKRILLGVFVLNLAFTNAQASLCSEIIKSSFNDILTKEQSVAVAVVTPKETQMFFLGKRSYKGTKLNSFSVFEIGSITKAYLGLLIAQAALDKKITLDSPIPNQFQPPRSKKPITWRHLANHTAGLPRLPDNLHLAKLSQPYKDYTKTHVLEFLANIAPHPGKAYLYSNFGAAVAGVALTEVYKMPISALFYELILNPHGLSDTKFFLSNDQQKRSLPVHFNGLKTAPWEWLSTSAFLSAGGLKSTLHDSARMMQAMMAPNDTHTAAYIALATMPSLEIASGNAVGLFWNYAMPDSLIWHNGATHGSYSFFGYDPEAQIGIVALSNSVTIKLGSTDTSLDIAAVNALKDLRGKNAANN